MVYVPAGRVTKLGTGARRAPVVAAGVDLDPPETETRALQNLDAAM